MNPYMLINLFPHVGFMVAAFAGVSTDEAGEIAHPLSFSEKKKRAISVECS